MRGALIAAAVAVAAGQATTLVWQQSEQYAVYTSSSLSEWRSG